MLVNAQDLFCRFLKKGILKTVGHARQSRLLKRLHWGQIGKAELAKAYAAAYTAAADANAYTVSTAAYAATRASYAAYASHAAADAATYTSRAAAYASSYAAATTREEIEKLFLGMCLE